MAPRLKTGNAAGMLGRRHPPSQAAAGHRSAQKRRRAAHWDLSANACISQMGSSQRCKPPPNLLVIHTVLPLALFAYSSPARIRPLTHRGRAELDGCDRVQLSASRSREARPDSVSLNRSWSWPIAPRPGALSLSGLLMASVAIPGWPRPGRSRMVVMAAACARRRGRAGALPRSVLRSSHDAISVRRRSQRGPNDPSRADSALNTVG
jgi:hypothetical protein